MNCTNCLRATSGRTKSGLCAKCFHAKRSAAAREKAVRCINCGTPCTRSDYTYCSACRYARSGWSEWTAERVAMLRERLYTFGETIRDVAKAMGCTRNAIIGAMYRHGIDHPNPAWKPKVREPWPLEMVPPGGCVYPFGHVDEPGFRFCGAPAANSHYCPEHHELCYRRDSELVEVAAE